MRYPIRTAALVCGAILTCGLPRARAQHHFDHHDHYVPHNGHVDVMHHDVHHDGPHYVQPPYYYPPAYDYYGQQQLQGAYPPPPPVTNSTPSVRVASNAIPYSGQGVTIVNPRNGTVNYTIDDAHNYSMGAGQSQRLSSKGTWLIAFNRGGGYADARYTLTEGTYEFVVGDQGWDIRRQSQAARLANAAPPAPVAPAANVVPAGVVFQGR